MKFLIAAFLLSICSFGLVWQSDRSEKNFLEGLIRQTQPEGQIIYTDRINTGDLENIRSRLKKNTFYDLRTTQNQNNVTLTRQEKKYLLGELESFDYPYWQENLFAGSKMIKEEEVMSYIKKTTQEYLENYNNPNNTETDRMTLVKGYQKPIVYKFSKPIYLRDRSLCLIFISSVCGNPCGFDELSFYKIENNTWMKWVVVGTNQY